MQTPLPDASAFVATIHGDLREAGFTEGTLLVRLRRALAELEELRGLSSEVTKAFRVEAIHEPPAPVVLDDVRWAMDRMTPMSFLRPGPPVLKRLDPRPTIGFQPMSPGYAPGDGARGSWAVLARLFRRGLRACRDILGGMLTQRDIDLADVNESRELLAGLGFNQATLHERVEAAVNEIKQARGPKFRLLGSPGEPPDEKA